MGENVFSSVPAGLPRALRRRFVACAKANVNCDEPEDGKIQGNNLWTEADVNNRFGTLAKGERRAFAGTGFCKFFGEPYAEKKVQNEIQPNLQKG